MDSDANHTIWVILLTGVNKQSNDGVVLFAPGVIVGAHVKYWVNK